jgi:hypothetical protein
MSSYSRRFDSPEAIGELATRLAQLPQVQKLARVSDNPGAELASTISGLEDSFDKILSEILPKLSAETQPDRLFNILIELGEHLRHVLYHIRDAPFYNYLSP